ncbi:hypothetical protein [Alteromonas sp. BMJM2]|uniref:hypothetical protein n=1 Tax=Alteromonas sp. BMJM2 TaxID=2954241 RepID=UPI0022B4B911|nr:hypothetical protein [Alteromonas sp. BMJM2]
MATYNVTANVVAEFNFTQVTLDPDNLDFLQAGDRVNFNSAGGTATFSGFSSSFWTNSSNISGNGYKIVRSGLSSGTTDSITASSGSGSDNMVCKTGVVDSTPNAFGLNNMTNIDPKARVGQGFRVLGINKGVPASVSATSTGDCYFLVNNSPIRRYNNYVVNSGDNITIVVEARHDYEQLSRTVTMTVGTRTETFNVVTRQWPLPEQVINLNISPPSDLYLKKHIANFFGGGFDVYLTDYLRGGGLVPSIEQNAHVPKTPPIEISDLYDTSSALYFIYKPPNKDIGANTLNGGKSLELSWNIVRDYNVGYGELARYLEYRYTFTSESDQLFSGGSASDVSIGSPTNSPGTWAQNNGSVRLYVSAPQNSERFYHGTITMYCRNAIDTSLVISKTVDWMMYFYGS